jgi:hypothetical protein
MVTYHYVKLYVSIIIQLEVININVQNFKFPIGFYSNPHPLWTPKNMALTPFTLNYIILYILHKNDVHFVFTPVVFSRTYVLFTLQSVLYYC